MLQSMESQRVRHNQVTELTELSHGFKAFSEARIKKFPSGKIHHELIIDIFNSYQDYPVFLTSAVISLYVLSPMR